MKIRRGYFSQTIGQVLQKELAPKLKKNDVIISELLWSWRCIMPHDAQEMVPVMFQSATSTLLVKVPSFMQLLYAGYQGMAIRDAVNNFLGYTLVKNVKMLK